MEMDARAQRIVEVAMELAERDGYEAVRLRELAQLAGVALGTVYRRFSSKEDILTAVLELEMPRFAERLPGVVQGHQSAEDRLIAFFQALTGLLVTRPRLARALIRTVSSADPEIAQRVLRYRGVMTELAASLLGGMERAPTEREAEAAFFLTQLWFAAMVGWAGGIYDEAGVMHQVRGATRLLVAGLAATA